MKKLFSGFMALLVTVSSMSISVKGMDFTEGDREETSTRQERFERDLPRGGIDKLETYSDGTKILYISTGRIKTVEEDYYRKYSESSAKVQSNTLSTANLCGHLIGTGAILIAGTIATVYTCSKVKGAEETSEKLAWGIAAVLEGLVTLGLSFFTAKPAYNHFTRDSYGRPTAWNIGQILAGNGNFSRTHYHVDGIVIVEIPPKTAEILRKTFYNCYGSPNIIHYANDDTSLSHKGAYALFPQKFYEGHDDHRENLHYFKYCLKKLGIKRNEWTEDRVQASRYTGGTWQFSSPYHRITWREWDQRYRNNFCYN